jgi:Uma2 family endonuclease
MVTATKYPNAVEEVQQRARHRPLMVEDLAVLPDDGNRYEIIGGQLILSPSPRVRHQQVSYQLSVVLGEYIASRGNAQALAAPMDVHLSPNDVVQPDLLVVLAVRADIIEDRGIMGAPDLVIEILSPSSYANDFLRKSRLYEQHGVREYWIVDPESETVSVQTLDGDRYAIGDELGRDDELRSQVLDGFVLPLASIFLTHADKPGQQSPDEPASDASE